MAVWRVWNGQATDQALVGLAYRPASTASDPLLIVGKLINLRREVDGAGEHLARATCWALSGSSLNAGSRGVRNPCGLTDRL